MLAVRQCDFQSYSDVERVEQSHARISKAAETEMFRLKTAHSLLYQEQELRIWTHIEAKLIELDWTPLEIGIHKHRKYLKLRPDMFVIRARQELSGFRSYDGFLSDVALQQTDLGPAPSCHPHERSVAWQDYHADVRAIATEIKLERTRRTLEEQKQAFLVGATRHEIVPELCVKRFIGR
ncbi:hypothetical protein ACM66B_004137 [Microbotryomycetes sp. NB124-2]